MQGLQRFAVDAKSTELCRKTERMNKGQQWINEEGTFFPVSGDTRLLQSPGDGVFVVTESTNPMMTRIGLRRIADSFEFDFKIYELGTGNRYRS